MLTAAEFLKETNIQIRKEQQSRCRSQSSTEEASLKTPVLGRGLSSDGCIVFDENVPFNLSRTSSNDTDKAKVYIHFGYNS